MYAGVNADGIAIQPKAMLPKPTKVDRFIEDFPIALTAEEIAALRVALVAFLKAEKRDAWNSGAEWMDQQWWSSEYSTGRLDSKYWGYVESTENPHREFGA
jgi:hypothetical protein